MKEKFIYGTKPSGAAVKNYIEEVTHLMKLWINDTPLRKVALKAVHVMPALLLQKPSKSSESKDRHAALEGRLKLWEEGKIERLLYEKQIIQERLKLPNSSMTITKISMKFRILMSQGNVSGAFKLLTNNMSNGILSLTDATLQLLESREPPLEVLIEGPIRRIHSVIYNNIDKFSILKAATLTKGGSGVSALDADEWCRISTLREFGTSSIDLDKTIAQLIKTLYIEKLETTTYRDAFTAYREIPLDKNLDDDQLVSEKF